MKSQYAPIGRRTFVKRSCCALTGTILLWSGCSRQPRIEWKSLTQEEAALIIAMSARVIPTDDTPGAVEAGVVHFIDQQLASHYLKWKLIYQEGLKGVQKIAQQTHETLFQKLTPEQMDVLLKRFESGDLPKALNPGNQITRFFNLFVDHCMQGFYGDPRHGGNKKWVSYQMLDLRVIDPQTVKF